MDDVEDAAGGIFYAPGIIATLPAIAVLADYALTFLLSGGREVILAYEASPLLRFAVAHDLVPLYTLGIVAFYYVASNLVLSLLHGSDLYPTGVALVALVSLTHFLGGFSWYVRDPLYSDTIVGLSLMCVLIALFLFAYSVSRGLWRPAGSGGDSPPPRSEKESY
ncbi:MAG: hypothetical protein QFX32_05435 [Methanolinea sp.]|nr:hypothetical protein [Methanolinea sp.]